ncbi:radical SAM-associated putative lipoprotein [Parabacteroides timonensis]|uniref:radical SAM-associated putative lipoprotein n=1 Tax=Parabacteroides timonensis TaxID=1871013 RepID=UPI00094EA8C1|nr:radical SAM-associated putative lipoprotein [Parabacteroides timonensis]
MKRLYPHLLKRTNWLLAGLLTLLGFSCSNDLDNDDDLVCEYGTPHANYEIKGKVVDRQNNPIPNVQIELRDSVPSRGWAHTDTLYTDNAGEFVWKTGEFPGKTFKLMATDIDDESNGGLFAADTSFVSFRDAEFVGGDDRWFSGSAIKDMKIILDEFVDTHKTSYAQYKIYGKVVDDKNYPVPGVVIRTTPSYLPEGAEKDFTRLVITNEHGMYSFTYDLEKDPADEYKVHATYMEGLWINYPFEEVTNTFNFEDIELTGGKGMLIGKGSKEVNFSIKLKTN